MGIAHDAGKHGLLRRDQGSLLTAERVVVEKGPLPGPGRAAAMTARLVACLSAPPALQG